MTTYRSQAKNEYKINQKLAVLKPNANGFTYVLCYEFPMTGGEQTTACNKASHRFENGEAAVKFAKSFVA